jgi:hypothetical protein
MTIKMGASWIAPSTLAEIRQARVPAPRVYRSAESEEVGASARALVLAETERRAAMTALRLARLRAERANARLCEALERETAMRQEMAGTAVLNRS